MTPKDILVAARGKIAQGWCQGVSAVYAPGRELDPNGETNWCIFGAIDRVTESEPVRDKQDVMQVLKIKSNRSAALNLIRGAGKSRGMNPDRIATWNDYPHRTQADVLKLFDDAIAAAPSETAA